MTKLTNRKFGIELEAVINISIDELVSRIQAKGIVCSYEGYTHEVMPGWKIVTDCSIITDGEGQGLEIVSPPLSGKDGLAQIKAVCEVLTEVGTINTSCGFHVHHDVADYNLNSWKILMKSYVKYEDEIDNFMPRSRKGNSNRFCRRLSSACIISGFNLKDTFTFIESKKTVQDIISIWDRGNYSDRYYNINVKSYAVYGTVEFRHHSGTVEYEKIVNWILLTQGLVERGASEKKVSPKTPNKNQWFESLMYTAGVQSSVSKFYTGRKALLAV